MKEQDAFLAEQAYNRLVSTFEDASRSVASAASRDVSSPLPVVLDIGGYAVLVRSTSNLLRDRIWRPLAHLEIAPDGVLPDFTIDVIDGSELDEAFIALPAPAQRVSSEQETQEYEVGPYLFTLHGDCVLTVRNEIANHTVGIVRDPLHWPLEHYQQAIFIALYQHLIGRGLYLIHASAIGRDGKVLLLSAKSGAGKTTTMLTCVQAGFDFYSDDATLLRRTSQGRIEAVSLLGTMNVTPRTIQWFPELMPYASEAAVRTGKRLVMIREAFPRSMASVGEVHAVIAPEITDQAHASVLPINKMSLLSELLPFSLDLHDVTAANEHLDFLLDLLVSVPSYRLALAPAREDLPRLLGQLLATSD